MPAVSVVIPTYNRLPLLLEAVESVREQTFADWELIVADDGSTDGSAEAVEALGDARIRVLRLPRAGRAAVARNAGVASARGEWIAFLDSDDLWEPRKLEVQLSATFAAGARWSYTGYTLMDDARRPLPLHRGQFRALSGSIVRELLTTETGAIMPTLLIERALLREVGGLDETLPMRDDMDLVLRLAARAPVAAVEETLARVRQHGGRMTASADAPHAATMRVYERFLRRERDPALRRIAFARCAQLSLAGAAYESKRGRHRRAAWMVFRSLRFDPPPGQWIQTAWDVALRALRLR